MREHNLKVLPIHFADVRARVKKAEFRLNDRDFRVGDVVNLREWESPSPTVDTPDASEFSTEKGYSGEVETRVVTHVLTHEAFWAVPDGWVIISMADPGDSDVEETNVTPFLTSRLVTGAKVAPAAVLRGAIDADLQSVVVAGWIPEPGVEGPGELFVAASDRDDKTVYLLRRAEHALLSGDL